MVGCFRDDIDMQIDAWPPVLCLCGACVCVVGHPRWNIKKLVFVILDEAKASKGPRFSRQNSKWSITGMLHN